MNRLEGKQVREQRFKMSRLIKIRANRLQRQTRVRRKIRGTSNRPRLSVFISLRHIYAQIINDEKGVTLISSSSLKFKPSNKSEIAQQIGEDIAKKCKDAKIKQIVLDRGFKAYHGRIKILVEAIRKQGLKF